VKGDVTTVNAAFGRNPAIFARACGVAAMLGVTWFAAAMLALQAGSSGLDWTRHYVSQFANGARGWLFPLGVLGHAAGNFALGIGLYRSLRGSVLGAWASAAFLLATLGLAFSGLFAVDPPGATASMQDAIHRTAATLSFAVEIAALLLFSVAFARDPAWRERARVSLALAALGALAAAAFLAALVTGVRGGLAERAALASFMAWEFWAGAQLAFRRWG
jgi:hypothetical membrane protein